MYTLSKTFQQQEEVSRCSYPNKKFLLSNNIWQTVNSNLTDCNLRSKIFAFVFLKVLYLLWSSKLCVVDHFSSKSHSGPSAVGQDLSRPKMHIWHGKEPERKKIHGIVFVGCSLTSAWHHRHFFFLAKGFMIMSRIMICVGVNRSSKTCGYFLVQLWEKNRVPARVIIGFYHLLVT